MQVTIGLKRASLDLELETSVSQEELLASLEHADTQSVVLADDKGRKIFIPAGSLSYAVIGEAEPRRVGFGLGN